MVAGSTLLALAPGRAQAVSNLLRESIKPGTTLTYSSGFRSLLRHCEEHGLCPLPVDAFSLISWMEDVTGRAHDPIRPTTVRKYRSAIRWHHLMSGVGWPLQGNALVNTAFRALQARYPEGERTLKVPISLSLLLSLCAQIPAWPYVPLLAFDDLAWVTASVLLLFGTLRGGEALAYPGSDRPVLRGRMVYPLLGSAGGVAGVHILVPNPKTEQAKQYQHAYALDTGCASFPLNPSSVLATYRQRASSLAIGVLGEAPALRDRAGDTLTRAFMIGRCQDLAARAGIAVRDEQGTPIPFALASWRAGYVLSARLAGVPEFDIRQAGRWASLAGPMPYSYGTTEAMQAASQRILAQTFSGEPRGSSVRGIMTTSGIFENLA